MVTKTETTAIITQAKTLQMSQPSVKRWLKHFFFMPAAKRYFSKQDQYEIAQAVKQAEQGHVGEIQVVIEGHIPATQAYQHNTHMRARQLFAELGVWDTQLNSGVLLYLNLCERKVEIVIDRGLQQATQQQVWDEICQKIVADLAQQKFRIAVIDGVTEIGKMLNHFYSHLQGDLGNELPDTPILLR